MRINLIVTKASFYFAFQGRYTQCMKKIVLVWITCVLLAVALLAWAGKDIFPEKSGEFGNGAALIHGSFTLTGGNGETVTEKDFRGQYMLVYFGFTHCPDICPTTLLLMQNVVSRIGPRGRDIRPIFISVDPERDTPKITAEYASHFGSDMVGLSGTPEQIKAVADHFKIYYSKVEAPDSALGYMIDHSGFIYLMGPDASYLTHFPHNVSERELEEGLRKYVR
jgi:cytochrome oxidase Cu insertion factor (SCO1/SenC/PrrC family)